MSSINYDLNKIKCFIFDVDGVLSSQSVSLHHDGEPMRTVNVRDGYALHLAARLGFGLAIITGGNSEAVRLRFEKLGIRDIYMKASNKVEQFTHYLSIRPYKTEEIAYIGDDIPDYQVMEMVGLPIAPADATPEIKSIAKYISPFHGGHGVARDVISQVLQVQGLWMRGEAFGW